MSQIGSLGAFPAAPGFVTVGADLKPSRTSSVLTDPACNTEPKVRSSPFCRCWRLHSKVYVCLYHIYVSIHYSYLWEQEKGKISFTSTLNLGRKRMKNTFLNRDVTWLMGKSLFRGLMRISSLNTRCGKLNQYFHFLNLQVAHLIDKVVTWVFFTLPRQQFTGQEMSGQLLGAQFHNKLQSVARKPVRPPFIASTRVAVRAETSQQRWVGVCRGWCWCVPARSVPTDTAAGRETQLYCFIRSCN